ncbi:uncharacterized protein SPSK_01526 [Sporothrix schenckii 1099-18]|uniref:Glucose-methanol-choline oxidoreductase N-terminal domain-containing protein n=1 Tax=Sporothrix schenckii 1099-18 TaxID=1397361 RepID=A0A0F2MB84_SPOSC|nr:uncharacterized protein SPSK_01526 [Sporothrix schenckii 1099-18]KJR86907.1 hypothetical protein SPSK_01526 [Sporothrix schenckii 1099-18]
MWPFSEAYPERKVGDVDGETFDYIVVGGGTAGSVVASRLSEDPSVSVLLLERGPLKDVFMSRIPLLSQNFTSSWSTGVQDRFSEPIAGYNDRRLQLSGGEGLGGTSRLNGLLVTRGAPGGYNEWASDLGLDGWAWDDIEPYFERMEAAVDRRDADHRGQEGRQGKAHGASFEKACKAVGLPVETDCNAPAASAQGYFSLDAAVYQDGTRVSAYRAYLNKRIALERRGRLTICTEALVTKLELNDGVVPDSDSADARATGVYVASAPTDQDEIGKPVLVKARREIIVCGGAFRTPQLLLLSGLGPRAHLQEKGIPVVRDLPAVGQHLSDHFGIPIMIQLPVMDTAHSVIEKPLVGIRSFVEYLWSGSGLLSMPSNTTTIFARTTAMDETTYRTSETPALNDATRPGNVPDVELMLIPVNAINLEAIGCAPHAATQGRGFLTLYTTMVQLRTTGHLELVSTTDPKAHARVHYPEMVDDDGVGKDDWAAVRRAVRFTMRLADEFVQNSGYPQKPAAILFGPGMDMDILRDVTKGRPGERQTTPTATAPTPSESGDIQPLEKTWKTVTDAEIDAYVRETGQTGLHFCCTARMAPTAKDGVVDARLKVHGVSGLRIADASVFPRIPSGHTMVPSLMVGERCADFIKAAWAGQ